MRFLAAIGCVLLLTGADTAPSSAPASAPPVAPTVSSPELSALRASLARTQKVSARFKQTRHWAALEDVLVTQGRFQYQRGGKLVWKSNPPHESELILEGNSATLRFPALNTTQSFDFGSEPGMGRLFDTLRAVLEGNLDQLEPLFAATVTQKSPLTVTLEPRSPEVAKVVTRLRLGFDPKYQLTQVVLEESGGDRTEIQFREHVIETRAPGTRPEARP